MLCLAASTLLAGCGVLRTVGLQQAPRLAHWKLDSYFDFDDAQSPQVRAAIARWFQWQREAQMPELLALIGRAGAQLAEPTDAAQLCRGWDEIGRHADAALERAALELAPVAVTLRPAQLEHLERRYRKSLDEVRRDVLQPDDGERSRALVKRTVERFESVYGRLDEAQRRQVAAGVAASPFDADRFVAERRARQADSMAVLRRIVDDKLPLPAAQAALRTLALNVTTSPRPDYRVYQRKLIDYNCGFAAEIHNTTTPAQRQTARSRLADWEADLRALANGG